MKEIVIGDNEEGKKLDRFLTSYLKEASTGFIYKMLRKKNITLNDKKAKGTEVLKKGDSIKIFFSDETFLKFRGEKGGAGKDFAGAISKLGALPVIYEDSDIVLVNKPASVLSQKSSADDLSLNEWLLNYLYDKKAVTDKSLETYRPSVCNRLDRNTSGLVICAKSLKGARLMNSLIKERRIRKFYRTIVTGNIEDYAHLTGYLFKDEKKNVVHIKEEDPGDERYSYIETTYRKIEYYKDKDLSLLEVELITGKTHQIRAHLSSIDHPIIGDAKYGGDMSFGLKYQLLHSYRVVFPADLPEGFEHLRGREFIAREPYEFLKITGGA
ncbi:MAG: RluA family pseudouridine synthase [Butyrivibrio sp.]|nr:RluA family pseudouridine synthase [Butyrivibrio sp.]